MTTWTLRTERFDTPDATTLRRDYYDEVASRYWGRPATPAEIDEGLVDGRTPTAAGGHPSNAASPG